MTESLNLVSASANRDSWTGVSPSRWGLATVAILMLGLVSSPSGASESIPKTLNTQLPYPTAVSLVHESTGWTYRQTATSAPLYFNEKDSPGKSACDSACETQWYPLIAQAHDQRILGEWSTFKRADGRLQWAFRKRPVYTHIHDSPDKPVGDGEDGSWHLMPHFATPLKGSGGS